MMGLFRRLLRRAFGGGSLGPLDVAFGLGFLDIIIEAVEEIAEMEEEYEVYEAYEEFEEEECFEDEEFFEDEQYE